MTETNKLDAKGGDWDQDDEDDNWDDWGDAEDNHSEADLNTTNTQKTVVAKTKTTIAENGNSDNNFGKEEINKNVLEESKSSWGWKGMVSSVLSTATEGLGKVSQGLNQVIGVPDPEEMARMNAAEEATTTKVEKRTDGATENVDTTPVFGLSLVTTLGSKVLNTGLDTLEGIGKKTMNILQENDPMLMNKRKMLGLEAERPNLSEILKEAKKDADQLEHTLNELKIEKCKELLRFESLFENKCGLVHLEALEILSKESTLKLQTLLSAVSGNALNELQETINEVRELMEFEDLEGESDGDYAASELNEKLVAAITDVDLQIQFDDIANTWTQSLDWIATDAVNATEQDIFAKGITLLADTCALEMNKLHKIAELLLVKEHHSTANEVDCIVQLCKQFSEHLHGLTNRFASTLNSFVDKDSSEEAKKHISTLFTEMLVAIQHIEKAFHLFLPILQIGAA